MPGGPVDDGQEPLWDESADPANADLIQAAPAATAGLHAARTVGAVGEPAIA
ncbi:hypothetical protein [Yimella sp. NH-Cas1]|uniref:hypothetical protein n=1 Tax=Yimella sp. NH-Cas1 TaxID=2917726 RepID=UPI001EFA7EDC|nr:hypothetical protein [Yimella sp. NH-Cas1]MCG8655500.1 hypothetical protein [Yimella sp. NH-Cas1]